MSRHFLLGILAWLFMIAVTAPAAFGTAERQDTPAALIDQARRWV